MPNDPAMPKVARLYRFPVKGMTAEPRERLRVGEDGVIEGDRVLGFLRADAGEPERQIAGRDWWRKQRFVQLMEIPGLARLRVAYERPVLSVHLDGALLAEGDVGSEADRERLAEAVSGFVATLDGSHARTAGALRLIGDGVTPAFHDRGARYVTLVGTGSLAALEEVAGGPPASAGIPGGVDERRFRMNVVAEGLAPWEELDWIGRTVTVGGVEFDVAGPVVRCLATHANPETGARDIEVLTTLTRVFGQEEPTMGVLLQARGSGEIAAGDAVRASD